MERPSTFVSEENKNIGEMKFTRKNLESALGEVKSHAIVEVDEKFAGFTYNRKLDAKTMSDLEEAFGSVTGIDPLVEGENTVRISFMTIY